MQAAVVRRGPTPFALVWVDADTLRDPVAANGAAQALCPAFPDVPILLVAREADRRIRYHGRADLVRAASRLDLGKQNRWLPLVP